MLFGFNLSMMVMIDGVYANHTNHDRVVLLLGNFKQTESGSDCDCIYFISYGIQNTNVILKINYDWLYNIM